MEVCPKAEIEIKEKIKKNILEVIIFIWLLLKKRFRNNNNHFGL